MFGRNCQQSCGADLNCKGLRFCLPDPYGCSCASGWFGSRCEKGQPAFVSAKQVYWICFTFLPIVTALFSVASLSQRHVRAGLQVQLQLPERRSLQPLQWLSLSGRVEGTQLSETRYHRNHIHVILLFVSTDKWDKPQGFSCQLRCSCKDSFISQASLLSSPLLSPPLLSLSDWAPQILDLEGNLERNLNSSPKIYCSATGNPLPSHNSIELRKPDGTVLKVESHSLLARSKKTKHFQCFQSTCYAMQKVIQVNMGSQSRFIILFERLHFNSAMVFLKMSNSS